MAAIREEGGTAVDAFTASGIPDSERNRIAAVCRHAHETARVAPENNDAFPVPGASDENAGNGADGLRRITFEIGLLELFPGIESHELAVGRPEWRRVAAKNFRAGKQFGLKRTQGLDPNTKNSIVAGCEISQSCTIGRKREPSAAG